MEGCREVYTSTFIVLFVVVIKTFLLLLQYLSFLCVPENSSLSCHHVLLVVIHYRIWSPRILSLLLIHQVSELLKDSNQHHQSCNYFFVMGKRYWVKTTSNIILIFLSSSKKEILRSSRFVQCDSLSCFRGNNFC